ncbi:MAG: WecB/TagA/CpsF family glycosyltransferase [Ignavibacteriales bacterium]|nr:WecB/TagA/CpsF family glycosyltransferase [Ignavibacteriales bacterium]
MRTAEIFGIPIALTRKEALIGVVDSLLRSGRKGWICYANVHTLNLALSYPWLRRFYRSALLNYCDGMGVKLGGRLLGIQIPERLTLPDFFDDLCRNAEERGYRLFFLGSSQESLKSCVQLLKSKFPRLLISGYHHGYFDHSDGIDVIAAIRRAKPHLLFVGMGVPAQEKWVLRNFSSLDASLIWMCGGVFELLCGARSRAPRWMTQYGLEWLYRLLQEPRRLWKRYLIGNPFFACRLMRQWLNQYLPGRSRHEGTSADEKRHPHRLTSSRLRVFVP